MEFTNGELDTIICLCDNWIENNPCKSEDECDSCNVGKGFCIYTMAKTLKTKIEPALKNTIFRM